MPTEVELYDAALTHLLKMTSKRLLMLLKN